MVRIRLRSYGVRLDILCVVACLSTLQAIFVSSHRNYINLNSTVRPLLHEHSIEVLKQNDFGGYTVPALGLYPFQWNWDAGFIAAGWAAFDVDRAWEEMETLFSGQWADGMIPSILFWKASDTYFPGPEIWGTKENPSNSTGITQPPIAGVIVRYLYDCTARTNRRLAQQKVSKLFPKILAYHRWWYKARDPLNTGLVAIIHPWESGMDNSPAWDEALHAFPVDDIPPYEREDLKHVNASMRPSKDTYDHYLTLLYRFKAANYDPEKLYWMSPFRMTDLCTNSVLFRANRDMRFLARMLGKKEEVREINTWLRKGKERFQWLWDMDSGLFKCENQLTGKLSSARISGAFLPLFAGVASQDQAAALASNLKLWIDEVKFGVPSADPAGPVFDPVKYWSGPLWININWMISSGLRHYGYNELAEKIEMDSLTVISESGLREYFNPRTGEGAGGESFSWTAALYLAWLDGEVL
ncbi:mannosylglycerate hydrolase [Marchantia polymorpha subsp. ruderalis]